MTRRRTHLSLDHLVYTQNSKNQLSIPIWEVIIYWLDLIPLKDYSWTGKNQFQSMQI